MKDMFKKRQRNISVLLLAVALTSVMPTSVVYAQVAPSASSLSESTVKALQEALNKQGITVKTDGIFTPETREAVRKYQSQHHLPVTGEADKATLDKLGVVSRSSGTSTPVAVGQGAQPPAATTSPGQTPDGDGQGAMMSGPMMQGMMKTMQGMMGMMQAQAEQLPRQGQAQGGMTMNCPMMSGGQPGPAMMQMMQGMMQMMQSQMQPASKP